MAHDGMHHNPFPREGFTAARDGLLREVRDPEFPIALRGYDREAVDTYVMRVNQVVAELEATRSPEAAVRRALERVAEETRGVLERAHETADEITARSRAQAEDRLELVRREAADAIAAAEARVRELDGDAEVVWQDRQKLIDDMRVMATELLAVADAASERYPVDQPDGPLPGQLSGRALAESLAEAAEQPFDGEAVLEEHAGAEAEHAAQSADGAPEAAEAPEEPADAPGHPAEAVGQAAEGPGGAADAPGDPAETSSLDIADLPPPDPGEAASRGIDEPPPEHE